MSTIPTQALPAITHLPELIAALPDEMRNIGERIFFIERVQGYTDPPPAMQPWVERHFGNVEHVRTQTIVKVTNLFTLEATLFNTLRGKRPHTGEQQEQHRDTALDQIIHDHASDDMFANPLHETTADVFGRIRGEHCITASNVAKYDGWHGLVIFDEAHPLRFSRAQLHDYFGVALRWLHTAHQHDPAARYPLIVWNGLWKGGASITHGHLQMSLSAGMPYAQVERWRRAAADYHAHYQRSLSDDLWQLSHALGLSIGASNAADAVRGYASLTPLKDREVVLMSTSTSTAALNALWDATYTTLRTLIDAHGVRSFNLAVYLPPLAWHTSHANSPAVEPWYTLPVLVRIVDRGDPLSRMVSIGSMEVFASSVVSVDPFAIAASLR